jgi:hypothetical protein
MKATYLAFSMALAALLVTSCRKDKHEQPGPSSPALLVIKVDRPYLSIAQVDSAFATWTVNGQQQRIQLNKHNDSLSVPINRFQNGSGQLELHIFANKKYRNQYSSEFLFKKAVTIEGNTSIGFSGPASFLDPAWFPRVDLKDAIGHRAIVALRPEDPFFLIKSPGHATLEYTVDRGYWKTVGGIALAGRDVWTCNNACTDVPNEQHFLSLPGRIGNKPWNHISIAILFVVDDIGGGWILDFEEDI